MLKLQKDVDKLRTSFSTKVKERNDTGSEG